MIDLDALEAAASAATHGKWEREDSPYAVVVRHESWDQLVATTPRQANRDYIAACDPATVLALVRIAREHEQMRAERDDALALLHRTEDEKMALRAERDYWIPRASAVVLDCDRLRAERDAAQERINEFDGLLSRVLHELAGAASLCWWPNPSGVFNAEQAIGFVEAAIDELRAALRGKA